MSLSRITSALSTQTFRQSAITSISVFLSSGLGAVFYLFLAKLLGPHQYGLFSLSIAILGIVISVVDLGVTQGLVRFVGAHKDSGEYYPYAKLAFKSKLVMGIVVGLVFGLGANLFASFVFRQPELKSLLPLVGLAIFSQLLYSLSTSIFQGLQKFLPWGIMQVGTNIIRLVMLLPLILSGKLYSFSALVIFLLSYVIGFAASLVWLDKGFFKTPVTKMQSTEFWNFNRWTAVVGILTAVTARLDTVLTGRFLSLTQVGVYSLSNTMVSFLPQIASAIGAVTTAKFAGMKDREHEKTYLRKSLLFVSSLSVVFAILMIPVAMVVLWITGKSYAASFLPFLILLLGTAFFVSTNPIRDSLLYFHSNPKFFVGLSLIQATVVTLASLILIPLYGVVGSSLAVTISLVCSGFISILYYVRITKK